MDESTPCVASCWRAGGRTRPPSRCTGAWDSSRWACGRATTRTTRMRSRWCSHSTRRRERSSRSPIKSGSSSRVDRRSMTRAAARRPREWYILWVRPGARLSIGCLASAAMAIGAPAAAQPASSAPATSTIARGLEAARTSDYAAAEKILLEVTSSRRPEALLGLAQTSLEQGRFAQAEDFAKRAGETESYRLAADAARAQVMAARGRVDEAIRLLRPSTGATGAAGRRARLELGELLVRTGHRAEASALLMKFADEYSSDAIPSTDAEGLAMVGRAMQLMRHPNDANRAYDESEKAEIAASGGKLHGSARVETLLWRADHFLDKYDARDAGAVLSEAMHLAPHRADTMVL